MSTSTMNESNQLRIELEIENNKSEFLNNNSTVIHIPFVDSSCEEEKSEENKILDEKTERLYCFLTVLFFALGFGFPLFWLLSLVFSMGVSDRVAKIVGKISNALCCLLCIAITIFLILFNCWIYYDSLKEASDGSQDRGLFVT